MTPAGWLTFIGVVVTALLGLLGSLASARANRRATERAAEMDGIKLQIQIREEQIKSWRDDAEALRRERDEERVSCDKKIADLREQMRELVVRLNVPEVE
jgi:hypothetical protein